MDLKGVLGVLKTIHQRVKYMKLVSGVLSIIAFSFIGLVTQSVGWGFASFVAVAVLTYPWPKKTAGED